MLATRLVARSARSGAQVVVAQRATTLLHGGLFNKAPTQLSAAQTQYRARALHHHAIDRAQAQQAPAQGSQVEFSVVPSETDPKVVIRWDDGRTSTFDNEFLFDHCRCPHCFHPKTKQRLRTVAGVPRNVPVSSLQVTGDSVHIVWGSTPAHESTLPLSFLRQASYDPPLASRQEILDQTPIHLWGSDIASKPPTVTYESVMPAHVGEEEAERGVLRWLDKVHEFGFCFVSGVPASTTATEELIRRMAFIRETLYGGFWDFTADMSKGDLAYSNQGLPAHTDTAYFTDPAGLQVFHCLSHPCPPGTGGETLLVDSFFAANELATRDPEAYATLSQLAVPFHASGNEGNILRPPINQPVLRHDHQGRLSQVRWNNEDRCVLGDGWSSQEIRQWYDAARKYEDIVTSKEAEYWVKLLPGTMVVLDNWRVMHGRAAFTGSRHMSGAYVGADDWRSKRRALIQKYRRSADPEQAVWGQGW